MNNRHQQYYKSRGNFRRRGPDGEFFGFDKHVNSFAPLANNQHSRPFRGRYQSRGLNDARGGRFQRGRGGGGDRGGGSKPSPSGLPMHHGQQQQQNTPLWNKITINDGKRFDRSFILKELASYVQGHIKPILYKSLETGDVQFLIEDNDVAQAIRAASRRIVAPNGQKIVINVNKCSAPVVRLSAADIAVLKTVLEQRYDALDNSINLSSFTEDPTVHEHGVYLALSRNNVMLTVVSLVGEACSTLKAIDLSKNRLRFLDFFANLTMLCPDVNRLSLSHNMIDNFLELEKLADWKNTLIELSLVGNPLSQRSRNEAYTTAIRRIFPNLQRLDGKEFATFKTGIEEELSTVNVVKLPPIKGNFFVNDEYEAICTSFINEFFTIFDSTEKQKREQLFQAYDDEAVFTMAAHNLTEEANRIRSSCWQDFIRDSHNIKHATMRERYRSKLVHKGRLPILSFFCKDFPVVQHDRSSFVTDISFATDSLICLNVSGLYRLVTNSSSSLGSTRFFTRIFLLVPKNNGVAIANEQLFSSTMTAEMQDRFRHNYASTTADGAKMPTTPVAPDVGGGQHSNQVMSTSDLHHESPQMMMKPSATVPTVDQSLAMLESLTDVNQKRQALTELFSQQSNMKEEWAKKCLEDCEWDFHKAAFTFTELNKSGSIPREAFK